MNSKIEKLPIVMLTHEFFPHKGGIATFTEEMARAAAEIGHPVEVWAPEHHNKNCQKFPFIVKWLPLKGSQDLSCQYKLIKELIKERRRLRDTILYLCDPGPVLAMSYLHFFKAFRPEKLLITFHGTEVQQFAASPGRKQMLNQLIRRADRISAPSEFTHKLITNNFSAAKLKTFLTPCALRSDFIPAERKLGRGKSSKVNILTVGRLHPRKGQAFIIEALAALGKTHRDKISFWIVGTGNKFGYETQLKKMASETDLDIKFFGEVDNDKLMKLYSEADIFAMTSVNFKKSVEGFGLVYLEAAAHGIPVIAHKVGGAPEAVSHEKNGLIVPPQNRDALRDAFAKLIEDPQLREQMGTYGYEWSRRNSWLHSAQLFFNNWDIKIDSSLEFSKDQLNEARNGPLPES
ncbi:glycosyltransferase family 4 protein [Puniceicoccaceae bacterium K14]|nr:glycosyltransferase family 4 protein [Puniceicoccaceae bacterium K14]